MRSGKQGERRRKKLVGREGEREREDGRRDRRGAGNDGVVREYGERKKKGRVAENIKITFRKKGNPNEFLFRNMSNKWGN